MKSILLSLVLALGFGSAAFATGSQPANSTQTGVVVFTATNSVTTSFSPGFTVPPVMTLFGSVTNLLPFTNSITATNFTLTIAATNASGAGWGSVAWTAAFPATRIQAGAAIASFTAATNITVTFAYPFANAPTVIAQPINMVVNSNAISQVSGISTTGFTLTCTGPMTNEWTAIGPINPNTAGASTVTY